MTGQATVFVVDDDDAVRQSLRMLLEADGLLVADYPDAESFLAGCPRDAWGCLVSDIRMPGWSGLELQARLEEHGILLPIIMLTGHADVPAAVRSLKAGAVDFMEKPFDPSRLLEQVRHAIGLDAERRDAQAQDSRRRELLDRLTPREREVIEHVATGSSNKLIASNLGISERTVELHRGRSMRKLEVRTVAGLVRLLGPSGFSEAPPER